MTPMVRWSVAGPPATTGAVHSSAVPVAGSWSYTVASATCPPASRPMGSRSVASETRCAMKQIKTLAFYLRVVFKMVDCKQVLSVTKIVHNV